VKPQPKLVSVIVPSLNSRPWLVAQLDALAQQDYRGDVEVIVADNGSRDGSRRDAWERACTQPGLQLVDASARRGPGAARNIGVTVARGEFFAFCDADDVASTSWLSELVASAREADLVGGSLDGRLLNRACPNRIEVPSPHRPHKGFLPAASGANLGIWAEVFAALGGFDERSLAGEDVDLTWRAQLDGYAYVPSGALIHKRFPDSAWDAARRFFGYGLGDAWLYKRFSAAGMPSRSKSETARMWRALATGFPGKPAEIRRHQWVTTLGLSVGHLVGSARHRVFYS
jgi:GT2 family glycosyltransferase